MTNNPHPEHTETEQRTNWTLRILLGVLAVAIVAVVVFAFFNFGGNDDNGADPTTSATDDTTPTAPEPTDTDSDDEGDDDVEVSPTPTGAAAPVLEAPLSGQEAIDELGDDMQIVADRNNMSVEELEELLLTDPNAVVGTTGHIYFK